MKYIKYAVQNSPINLRHDSYSHCFCLCRHWVNALLGKYPATITGWWWVPFRLSCVCVAHGYCDISSHTDNNSVNTCIVLFFVCFCKSYGPLFESRWTGKEAERAGEYMQQRASGQDSNPGWLHQGATVSAYGAPAYPVEQYGTPPLLSCWCTCNLRVPAVRVIMCMCVCVCVCVRPRIWLLPVGVYLTFFYEKRV